MCDYNISKDITFKDFAYFWLDEKVKPNCDIHKCYKKYLNHLNLRIFPYLGNYEIKNINRIVLERYFNKLKSANTLYKNRQNSTLKPSSVLKIKAIINSILNYACELDVIDKNYLKYIKINFNTSYDITVIKDIAAKKKNKINYYTIEEYKSVCKLLENELNHIYYDNPCSLDKVLYEYGRRLFILLALKTGMRRSELFGLAIGDGFNDIDLNTMEFEVNKSRHYAKDFGKYTKCCKTSNSIRRKSLPLSLKPFLINYFKILNDISYNNIYLFDFLSFDGVCTFFDKWQDIHKIRNIRFHDLRHTHATILLASGVDVKTISERLGHSNIQTTLNIYTDVLKELDKKAVNIIDKI